MPLPWVASFSEITDSPVTFPKPIIWPKSVGWEVFNKEMSKVSAKETWKAGGVSPPPQHSPGGSGSHYSR